MSSKKYKCSHSERKVYWVEEENYITGEMESRLVDERIDTFVDIDLHRFKCKNCGEIQYYSEKAKLGLI